jgi:predicted transport protein
LFYLDWLLDHQAEFKLLVIDKLGQKAADGIDWSAPRLLCIAGDFSRYDEHAVQQMNRNIELIRYRRFGNGFLLFELVNAASAESGASENGGPVSSGAYKTVSETLAELKEGMLRDLYEELRAFLLALGDDVQENTLKYYVAFKRLKNFACIEVHPGKGCLTTFAKVDPDTVKMESGFTRDVRKIGHFGTGDLEITLRSRDDLQKAKGFFQQSYEAS